MKTLNEIRYYLTGNKLQNDPANINQDHLTICRTFTTVEQFETLADRLTTNIEKAIK